MTTTPISNEKLKRFADALLEELWSTSDQEVREEMDKAGISPDDVQAEADDEFAAATRRAGRMRLLAAQKAVEASKRRRREPQRCDPKEARRRLTKAFSREGIDDVRMTLAAREGRGIPDEDLDGLIEDASDLGIDFDDASSKDKPSDS